MDFSRFLPYLLPALALGLALVLTPSVGALARQRGLVARPRADRWHKKPTALLGGVAIFAATAAVFLLLPSPGRPVQVVMTGSTLLFTVGLVDDLVRLGPYQKLAGQLLGAALVAGSGLLLPWSGWLPLDGALTLFWLVGITNALNLLDNMDGLAAGIGLLAALFLDIHCWMVGQAAAALLLGVFAAALLGFLVYNAHPASIFMGDCGSMFIGFLLAGMALVSVPERVGRWPLDLVPVLILSIPIYDTTFVTIMRRRAGRPVSQGGRDHTSHRLVARGLSERGAVWVLYGLATLAGLLALLSDLLATVWELALLLGFLAVLALLAFYLAGARVYQEPATPAPSGY